MRSLLFVAADERLRATVLSVANGIGWREAGADDDVDLVLIDADAARPAAAAAAVTRARADHDAPVIVLAEHLGPELLDATPHASGYALKPPSARELEAVFAAALHRYAGERSTSTRERWYRSTLRCIVDGIITTDENGRVTFMNPAAEQLTGFAEDDARGRALDEVFRAAPDAVDAGDAVERDVDAGHSPVLRLEQKGGGSFVIEHNSSAIVDERGGLLGVIVVFRDISERRRAEQRIALSDRMASIGTLAAGIAHELNNPLAFVTSNVEFVLDALDRIAADAGEAKPLDADSIESLRDAIEAMREARDGASRAAAIIKDMKVFIRHKSESGTLVDVNRTVGLALRLASNELKDRAQVLTSLGDVPPVLADEGELVQVLVNVLTNAAQALDEKANHTIKVTTSADENRAVVTISDSGRGIPPDHLGRIFEPFFTTKPIGGGVGLGLSIAHSIVTGFGGTISAASDVDVGTTITITLPSSNAGTTSVAKVAAAPGAAHEKRALARVLVVDDEQLIGTAIRRILVKHGLDVVVESDARKALERIERGDSFDVVLCDLMMPGFSGVDLYTAVGESAPALASRFVFMTGNAFTPKASELFETTTNVRLEKPFVPADLTRAVAEVMRRHGVSISLSS